MNLRRFLRAQWDRVAAVVFVLAGLGAMLAGYFGVSGTLEVGKQVPYLISGAMVGLFLLGIGALLWVAADLRDEWRKLGDIERHLPPRRNPEDQSDAS